MEQLIQELAYYILAPGVVFYFFCQYVKAAWSWGWFCAYITCFIFLLRFFMESGLPEILRLPGWILLQSVCGSIFLKKPLFHSIMVSVLPVSVFYICNGVLRFFGFFAVGNMEPKYVIVLRYADLAISLCTVFLLFLVLAHIKRFFREDADSVSALALLLLVIPLFFISLVEGIVNTTIYGNTLIWDHELGMVFPVINNMELFLLQTFACCCLLTTLIAYEMIIKAIGSEQSIRLMEQQAHEQEIYIQEARLRYEHTKSFRHDIKNHLGILRILLQSGKTGQAVRYLSNLEHVSESLSFPVNTGNAAVDALLGSKLAAAMQKKIAVKCELKIPKVTTPQDMDWCIILSNAVDNAINASQALKVNTGYIDITGRQKGNFYLLSVENRFDGERGGILEEGIGLSNIRAAVEKYEGTVNIEREKDIFRLNILLLISQP